MPKGVRQTGVINHSNAVRFSVNGIGNFRTRLFSENDVYSFTLIPAVMTLASGRMQNQLANFKSDKMQVEFKTIDIDEVFTLNTLLIYLKPTATSFPQ